MRWRKLIKDNQKNFSRLHMLIDVFVVTVSYALAWLIRFQGIFEHSAVQSKTVQEYMFMLIFIIPGYLLLYQAFDLYTPMRMQGRRLVLAGIVKANALGSLSSCLHFIILKNWIIPVLHWFHSSLSILPLSGACVCSYFIFCGICERKE